MKKIEKHNLLIISAVILSILAAAGYILLSLFGPERLLPPATFEECLSAPGSMILETYPEQCVSADGFKFTGPGEAAPDQ